MSLIRRPLVFLYGVFQAQVVDDRNPDVIIFAFVSSQHQPDTHPLSGVFLPPTKTSKMSSSSNIVAMKKVVQQLRFEASINRVKVIMMYFVFFQIAGGGNLIRYSDELTRLAATRR